MYEKFYFKQKKKEKINTYKSEKTETNKDVRWICPTQYRRAFWNKADNIQPPSCMNANAVKKLT